MVTVADLRRIMEELEDGGYGDSEVRFVSGLSFHPRHTALAPVAVPVPAGEPTAEKVFLLENLDRKQEYLEQSEVEAVHDSDECGFGI